jgi:hypothetical protein
VPDATPDTAGDATAAAASRRRAFVTKTNTRDARPAAPGNRRDFAGRADADDTAPRALLTIVSDPGHPIFVDGRHVGDGPQTVPLAPGRHVLRAGQGADAPTLAVDLARGERRRIVLR